MSFAALSSAHVVREGLKSGKFSGFRLLMQVSRGILSVIPCMWLTVEVCVVAVAVYALLTPGALRHESLCHPCEALGCQWYVDLAIAWVVF